MGKPTGFMEIARQTSTELPPEERIQNFNEFHIPLPQDEQQAQGARCMDCGVPFCQAGMMIGGMASGCPLNNLIPEWNDLVYQGKWDLAVHRLRATNRFPEFTSRVCPALCEAACTCGYTTGSPVTVKENEHAIVEYGYESGLLTACPPPTRTGKTVAVVGAGPAGLAVADYLNKRGHKVTVYEREDRVGGLLMYGIPNMKLEKQVIDRRVNIMKAEGIDFVTCADVGGSTPAQDVLDAHDAVVLACGAKQARDINARARCTGYLLCRGLPDQRDPQPAGFRLFRWQGRECQGQKGVGHRRRRYRQRLCRHCHPPGLRKRDQLEMMPCPPTERTAANAWPEWPKVLKTDYGQQEAIAVFGSDPRIYQTTVKEFYKNEAGQVCGALIAKLESKVVDEATGRRAMVPTGEEFAIECDLVLIAAGFTGCQPYVAEAFGVDLTKRGTVADTKYATNVPHVFTCGDMRRGQSLVVWALREGRDAAAEVDKSLMGYTNL